MARVGIFAVNMSPKSGGVYSLIEGLMSSAHHSKHQFVYLTDYRQSKLKLPDNVEVVARPKVTRLTTQSVLTLPGADILLRYRATGIALMSAITGISPRVYGAMDLWLWPHCFMPVPNMGKMVAICHDMIHRRYPQNFSPLALSRRARSEKSLVCCTSLLCPSQATINDLLAAYPHLAPKVRLFAEAPNEVMGPADCTKEMAELEEEFGEIPLFLFVGVDWPHKNHSLIINAAARLRTMTTRPFRVAFVGHRRGNEIAMEIIDRRVGDVVLDIGGVSRAKMVAFYRKATAMVFPSLCEGFGIPLVEAMRYGLPIIASNVSCIPEICGDAATLISPDSAQGWADEMLRFMIDPKYRQRRSEASGLRGRSFSWQRTWQEIDEVFAEAISGPDATATKRAEVMSDSIITTDSQGDISNGLKTV